MSPATGTQPGAADLAFHLPPELEAAEPAEVRGCGRDDVRLMVARRGDGTVTHHRFPEIVDVLRPGDLVVLNTSRTLPAALSARRADGTPLRLHFSTRLPGGRALVELRRPDGVGSVPFVDAEAGEILTLPAGATARLAAPWEEGTQRLWVAELSAAPARSPFAYLAANGSPIRYRHVDRPWPLWAYQTVYANEDGSAEMPSAGRAFTAGVLTRLVARGVGVAPVVLHAGVSSPEANEAPAPEWFRVPPATARWVDATRAGGGAVVAVGTSVVRALETVADAAGRAHPGEGWTELLVGPERGVRLVDGLLTGWHEAEASHLRLLEAVAGRDLLRRSYAEALEQRYLWHEFGDLHLLVP